MSAPEKFRTAPPFEDVASGMTARVIRLRSSPYLDKMVCQVCNIPLGVPEARALRDWLDMVIP